MFTLSLHPELYAISTWNDYNQCSISFCVKRLPRFIAICMTTNALC